jgi:hypothetical protein
VQAGLIAFSEKQYPSRLGKKLSIFLSGPAFLERRFHCPRERRAISSIESHTDHGYEVGNRFVLPRSIRHKFPGGAMPLPSHQAPSDAPS